MFNRLPTLTLLILIPFFQTTTAAETTCNAGDIAIGQAQTCSWFPAGPGGTASWPDCNGNFGFIWDNNFKSLSVSWKENICNGDWTEGGTYVHCANDKVVIVYLGDEKAQWSDCYQKDAQNVEMGPMVKTTSHVQWCCRALSNIKHDLSGLRKPIRRRRLEEVEA